MKPARETTNGSADDLLHKNPAHIPVDIELHDATNFRRIVRAREAVEQADAELRDAVARLVLMEISGRPSGLRWGSPGRLRTSVSGADEAPASGKSQPTGNGEHDDADADVDAAPDRGAVEGAGEGAGTEAEADEPDH